MTDSSRVKISDEQDLEGGEVTVLSLPSIGLRVKKSDIETWYKHNRESMSDIADRLDIGETSVLRLMEAAGIERRNGEDAVKGKLENIRSRPYAQETVLRKLHHEKGLSLSKIGEQFDMTGSGIKYWFEKHGIEVNDGKYEIPQWTTTYHSYEGYPVMKGCDGGVVPVHRLVMVMDGEDPHKVFGKNEWHVHHRNGFKCDNRPSNLELVNRKQHGEKHASRPMYHRKWTDDDLEMAVKFMLNPTKHLQE